MGNTHGPQTLVSVIGRGRRGRWWRRSMDGRGCGCAAGMRVNERFVMVIGFATRYSIVFNLSIATAVTSVKK